MFLNIIIVYKLVSSIQCRTCIITDFIKVLMVHICFMFVLQDSPRGDDYYGERGKEAKGLKWGQSGGGAGFSQG